MNPDPFVTEISRHIWDSKYRFRDGDAIHDRAQPGMVAQRRHRGEDGQQQDDQVRPDRGALLREFFRARR